MNGRNKHLVAWTAMCGALGTALLVCGAGAQVTDTGKVFYVSPGGSKANPGTAERPFATIEQAQAAVRHVLAAEGPGRGITVVVGGGIYLAPHGLSFDARDSGSPTAPVVYRAAEGETARIVGGTRLNANSLKRVEAPAILARLAPEARGHVYAAQLPRDVQSAAYPEIFHGNGGLFNVIYDDRILPLSRWPENGYTTVETVLDSGITPPRGGTFLYRDQAAEHVARWLTAAKDGELWLTGFWRVPFEIETVRVAKVDPEHRQITLAAPVAQGIGSKYTPLVNGTRHGEGKEQYYASNLVEEISHPGEWSYDFKTRTLYLWPPSEDVAAHELLLASSSAAVVTLDGSHNLQMIGLTVEDGTAEGIVVVHGERDLIAGNTVRNVGRGGIEVLDSNAVRVQSNDLMHLGSYGIHLVGGDRKTLAPGKNVADNNHIAYIGEQDRITEGIFLDGVGNEATHNLVHDAANGGFRYQGNDQLMAYNEIHHVGLDSGDLAVFYTNGDWAAQGNRVEHNFGHDATNANGTYLDDGATGRISSNNVFYHIASGVFLGGGHDNHVTGNLIVDCRIGIHVDNRGESRKYDQTARNLTGFLRTIDPNKAPWSTRYPHFLDDVLPNPTKPLGNVIENNLIAGAKTAYQVNAPAVVDAANNPSVPADAVTFDAKTLTFHSAVAGFREVSVAEDGLYLDSYRKRLPTDEETGRFVERTGTITFDSNVDVKASNKNTKPE